MEYGWCKSICNFYEKKRRRRKREPLTHFSNSSLVLSRVGNHEKGFKSSRSPFFPSFCQGRERGAGDEEGGGRRNSRRLKGGLTKAGRDKLSEDTSGGSRGRRWLWTKESTPLEQRTRAGTSLFFFYPSLVSEASSSSTESPHPSMWAFSHFLHLFLT